MYRNTAIALLATVALANLAGCDPKPSTPKVVNVKSHTCSLDAIDGNTEPLVHVKPGVVKFSGWALDDTTNTVPAKLQMFLKDAGGYSYVLDVVERQERPDVASYFKQDNLLKSGFSFESDLSAMQKGVYAISLTMSDEGRVAICQIKKNMIIE